MPGLVLDGVVAPVAAGEWVRSPALELLHAVGMARKNSALNIYMYVVDLQSCVSFGYTAR